MSKLKKINLSFEQGDLLQVKFFYSWNGNRTRRVSASYSMVFKLAKLQKKFKEDSQKHIFTSDELGEFFVENVLIEHILPLHPSEVTYSRIQFQLPNKNSRSIVKFNYELSSLRGTAKSERPENSSIIEGTYRCRFSNYEKISALSLIIRNVRSRPKLHYFINDLSQPLTYVFSGERGNTEVQFVVVGLTLNKIFDSLYDAFDVILEKII